MAMLAIRLFGRLDVSVAGAPVVGLDSRKAQELLAYLVLHRDKAHTREALATLLWADATPAKGRKYLRQALWRIHIATAPSAPCSLVSSDGEWISIHPHADLWLDVAQFEQICATLKTSTDRTLTASEAEQLETAVALYQGDVLEGWYDEWCLFERERLQNLYVDALETLVDHALQTGAFGAGVQNARRLLAVDPARERTHRRLMKLYWLSGDRTSAMRQYQRCTTVLARELGVTPADTTRALFEQICASDPGRAERTPSAPPPAPDALPAGLIAQSTLNQMLTFQSLLTSVQAQIQADIARLEQLLGQSSLDRHRNKE